MQVKKQQLEYRHRAMDWFTIEKGVKKKNALYCHHAYMQSISCEMPGLNHKLESRLLGEISITSDMQMIILKWKKVKRN